MTLRRNKTRREVKCTWFEKSLVWLLHGLLPPRHQHMLQKIHHPEQWKRQLLSRLECPISNSIKTYISPTNKPNVEVKVGQKKLSQIAEIICSLAQKYQLCTALHKKSNPKYSELYDDNSNGWLTFLISLASSASIRDGKTTCMSGRMMGRDNTSKSSICYGI